MDAISWAVVIAVATSPVLAFTGDATWYAEPYVGRPMRNGDVYTGTGLTCAVDGIVWRMFAGKMLLVCAGMRCVTCTVTDTGRLWQAGVALDLSPAVFARLAPLAQGRVDVRAWVLR